MSDGFEEIRLAIKFCESRNIKEDSKIYKACIDAFSTAASIYGKELKVLLKEAIDEIKYLEHENAQKSYTYEMSGRVCRLISKSEKYLNNGNT